MREHTYTHSQMYKTHQTIISGNGEGWLPISFRRTGTDRQVHIPTGILNPLSTEEATGFGASPDFTFPLRETYRCLSKIAEG